MTLKKFVVCCSILLLSVMMVNVDSAQAAKKSAKTEQTKKSSKSEKHTKSDKHKKSEKHKKSSKQHKSKVEICHLDDDTGLFHVISVSQKSVQKHLSKHGDALPGTFFADVDGDGFGDPAGATDRCPNPGFVDNADDAFPNDPSEHADSDGDGVGDNADAFPNDPTETADSDGDGIGDNADAFPNDPTETADSDGDGIGDNADACPNEAGLPENNGCPVVVPTLGANIVTGNVTPGWNQNKVSLVLGDFNSGYSIQNLSRGITGYNFESVSIAVGDVNNDGLDDIVAVGEGSESFRDPNRGNCVVGLSRVKVALAPNLTSFSQAADITGNCWQGVSAGIPVLADFDGDGNLDIAAKSFTNLSVFEGNGDGTFGVENKLPTVGEPRGLAAGDIDGDGNIDLAAAGESGFGAIGLHYGDGAFGFSLQIIASGENPSTVLIADVDNDGDGDVISGNRGAEYVVYTNNGGAFSRGSIPGGIWGRVLLTADLDGDGLVDLVTSTNGGSSIQVRLNNGAGDFGTPTDYGTGAFPVAASLGDFDGDGNADIATVNFWANSTSLLLGNSDGTFSTSSDVGPLPTAPNSVGVGTFQ